MFPYRKRPEFEILGTEGDTLYTRTLGQNLAVSSLGYGAMGLTGLCGTGASREDAYKVLHAAVEQGITLFDTAATYDPFTNEELLGENTLYKRTTDILTLASATK